MCSCIHKRRIYAHTYIPGCTHALLVLYTCTHTHTHASPHVHMNPHNSVPKAIIIPENVSFPAPLQIQYWRIVEEEEEVEEWWYRSWGKEENRETHSSLRGQRREKGCTLRKWPNEKEHGSHTTACFHSSEPPSRNLDWKQSCCALVIGCGFKNSRRTRSICGVKRKHSSD